MCGGNNLRSESANFFRSVQHTTYVAVDILFEYESLAALADADDVSVSVMRVFRSQTIVLKVSGYY